MSGSEELREKAWRLINDAKNSTGLKRRRMLIAEAFELMQRARGGEDEATPEGGLYRICFLRNDRIALWIDLDTESKADAVWVANALQEACSDEYGDFELWHGLTCILGNDTKRGWKPPAPSAEISAATQRRLLETEEALLNSRQAIAGSRKLLEVSARLRKQLTGHDTQ
jgi:hypothetical protein